jgi:hypothetical protein
MHFRSQRLAFLANFLGDKPRKIFDRNHSHSSQMFECRACMTKLTFFDRRNQSIEREFENGGKYRISVFSFRRNATKLENGP